MKYSKLFLDNLHVMSGRSYSSRKIDSINKDVSCFSCCSIMHSSKILNIYESASCPICIIDAVLETTNKNLIKQMNDEHFGYVETKADYVVNLRLE